MDNNVHILNLATYEKPQVIESTNKEWVAYGQQNNFYDWLMVIPVNLSVATNSSW